MRLLLLVLCAILTAAPTATLASHCHGDVTLRNAADAHAWRHCTHIDGNLRILVSQLHDTAETGQEHRRRSGSDNPLVDFG